MLGYMASFEQFHPTDLLNYSKLAEENGFGGVSASDHFHPWTPQQGHSAFVWAWLGALGATTNLKFGTGVTPPGYRYHPAILAQAAATLEAMYPGRFTLGLGAGEALNEHIVGGYWPEAAVRSQVLFEAIGVIQALLTGKVVKHRGEHFNVESARIYTMPETPPPIVIATSGPINAQKTGKLVDGILTVGAADEKLKMLMDRFEKGAREAGKDPDSMIKILQVKVSYATTTEAAVEQAVKEWPNGGMAFPKGDIRNPEDFEAMAKNVEAKHFKNRVLMSADIDEHIAAIQHYIDLGFKEIYIHNVGRNQEEFLKVYGQKVVNALKW
jgi:G6PDH family F420-dependent oxidoreductase